MKKMIIFKIVIILFLFVVLFNINSQTVIETETVQTPNTSPTNKITYLAHEEHNKEILLLKKKIKSIKAYVDKQINKTHLKCMADNIYYESRGEPFLGKIAVARVVINRVRNSKFPNDPCKVIYQKLIVKDKEQEGQYKIVCQFSWVCENLPPPRDKKTYNQGLNIAKLILAEDKWKNFLSSRILFFHHIDINQGKNYKTKIVIGNHLFYEL